MPLRPDAAARLDQMLRVRPFTDLFVGARDETSRRLDVFRQLPAGWKFDVWTSINEAITPSNGVAMLRDTSARTRSIEHLRSATTPMPPAPLTSNYYPSPAVAAGGVLKHAALLQTLEPFTANSDATAAVFATAMAVGIPPELQYIHPTSGPELDRMQSLQRIVDAAAFEGSTSIRDGIELVLTNAGTRDEFGFRMWSNNGDLAQKVLGEHPRARPPDQRDHPWSTVRRTIAHAAPPRVLQDIRQGDQRLNFDVLDYAVVLLADQLIPARTARSYDDRATLRHKLRSVDAAWNALQRTFGTATAADITLELANEIGPRTLQQVSSSWSSGGVDRSGSPMPYWPVLRDFQSSLRRLGLPDLGMETEMLTGRYAYLDESHASTVLPRNEAVSTLALSNMLRCHGDRPRLFDTYSTWNTWAAKFARKNSHFVSYAPILDDSGAPITSKGGEVHRDFCIDLKGDGFYDIVVQLHPHNNEFSSVSDARAFVPQLLRMAPFYRDLGIRKVHFVHADPDGHKLQTELITQMNRDIRSGRRTGWHRVMTGYRDNQGSAAFGFRHRRGRFTELEPVSHSGSLAVFQVAKQGLRDEGRRCALAADRHDGRAPGYTSTAYWGLPPGSGIEPPSAIHTVQLGSDRLQTADRKLHLQKKEGSQREEVILHPFGPRHKVHSDGEAYAQEAERKGATVGPVIDDVFWGAVKDEHQALGVALDPTALEVIKVHDGADIPMDQAEEKRLEWENRFRSLAREAADQFSARGLDHLGDPHVDAVMRYARTKGADFDRDGLFRVIENTSETGVPASVHLEVFFSVFHLRAVLNASEVCTKFDITGDLAARLTRAQHDFFERVDSLIEVESRDPEDIVSESMTDFGAAIIATAQLNVPGIDIGAIVHRHRDAMDRERSTAFGVGPEPGGLVAPALLRT
jgi:hypothetical protein